MASGARDVILLEGIQVPAALGVTAAERRARRPVLLDLEVEYDLRASGASDRIGQTVAGILGQPGAHAENGRTVPQ